MKILVWTLYKLSLVIIALLIKSRLVIFRRNVKIALDHRKISKFKSLKDVTKFKGTLISGYGI